MEKRDSQQMSAALAVWLAAKLAVSEVRITSFKAAAGAGFSAETIFVVAQYSQDGKERTRKLVLRRQNEGSDLFLGSDLQLPYQMMKSVGAASAGAIPVPEVIGIEFDRDILGAPFLVMECLDGKIVPQTPNYNRQGWVHDLPEAQRGTVWSNALEMISRIHKLDWRKGFEFLDQPARGKTGLDQYLHWVEEWYLWARADRPHPLADIALDYLKKNKPADAEVGVLWGDPTPSNILFNDDLSISAVIDWEMGALGPPEIDIAWWMFFDQLFSVGMGEVRMAGLPDPASTIAQYEVLLGRKLKNMDYYSVLATFRMAIVGMRAVDRQIELGRLPVTTTARTHAPIMCILAGKLNQPVPEIGQDFYDFIKVLGF
jgi:aminoglycoside phosphotransferase (APT) family kinase protein